MNEKWKNRLGTIVMLLLIVVFMYCVLGVKNQEETGKLFFPFGYRPVVILSGSMEDTLETGAVVIVKKTKEIEVNDIVFFITDEDVPVIHRCVEKTKENHLLTKGDANGHMDFEPVTMEQVQGKVVHVFNWLAPMLTKS